MSRVRLALPPLAELLQAPRPLAVPLECARLDRAGRVIELGPRTLEALGQDARGLALECFLHPQDSLLTSIELPPLPAARINTAVDCAAQALILGAGEQMHVAHGPRDAQGQVTLSWLPKRRLQALGELLQQAGLKLSGLYPAPYALAVPAPGQHTLCLLDGQLLLRHSAAQASVQPLVEETLEQLRASGIGLGWIGDDAPEGALQRLPIEQRWSGAAPAWGLQAGATAARGAVQGWGRALGCCALAVTVWVVGLNLYAAREAEQGQRLKSQMSQRVRQVFPQLPVVLNPLQQARQQLAAQQSGAADPGQGFVNLLLQAGSAMPFMVGSVQSLSYADQRLQLELLPDTPKRADSGWQGALAQAGYSVQAQANGWTLSPAAGEPANGADNAPGAEDE
ncbi:type II secretion system protein GspL [Pseudomonas protegens]|uniref:type II secretion system protein GspL n=2 Tax=Pseudomonas protegens TaxID=380021 RepID=UPI002761777F|nr:type II secretion system protein GspL [Pseudomonas protegens]MDP9530811.1 type II secretion system protein GspL [Pseudomonas protegens]